MSDSHTTATHRITAARAGRTRSRNATGWVSLALAGLIALGGCTAPETSDDPGGTPASSGPVETTIPATTEPPPPTTAAVYKPATAQGPAQNVPVPVLPDKAKEFSKEGLIAFAEYWFSTLGYVFETGDSAPMMAITDPACKTCTQINEPVGTWYKEGGWIVGGQMNVLQSTTTFNETPDGSYQAILLMRQTKVSYYQRDGSLSHDYPQDIAETNIVVATFEDNGWKAHTAEPMKKRP